MNDRYQHHGVRYSVRRVGERMWRWEIKTPKCVLGMHDEEGEITGNQHDAIWAARAAIERQTGFFLN